MMTTIGYAVSDLGRVTLHVTGDLDVAGAWDLRRSVNELAETGNRLFDVDLSALDFVDSSGLGQLARYWAAAATESLQLTLTGATDRFWALARSTGRQEQFAPTPLAS